MNEIQKPKINNINNKNNISDNHSPKEDQTFSTLQRIQSLLKRESALKKLCKQNF